MQPTVHRIKHRGEKMDSYTLQQTIARHWRKILILLITLAAFIYVFFSFTIVSLDIKTHDGISGNPTISASSATRNLTPLTLFGVNFVPREANVIGVTVNGYTTFKYVSLGVLHNSLSIDIYRDANAQKYTGKLDQQGCSTYNPTADDLLSYDCTTINGLYAYSSNTNSLPSNKLVADTPAVSQGVPYLGGVLGMDNTALYKPIYYTVAGNKTTYYGLPEGLSRDQLRSSRFIASPTMTDSNFLIVARTGDVYIAFVENGQVSYTKYPHPADFSTASDSVSCALTTNIAMCYYSPSRGSSTSKIKPVLVSINLQNKNQPTFDQASPDRQLFVENIAVDRTGTVFAKDGSNLFMMKREGAKARVIQLAREVASFSADTDAYFVSGSKVYKIDSKNNASYMIFQSPHLKVVSVSALASSLFINARINDGSDSIHKYKLDSTPHDSAVRRAIDTVPFAINTSLPVSDSEFIKDTLYVQLKVTINKTAKATSLSGAVDQESLTKAKQAVEQYLDNSGVDLSTLKIVYSF